MENGNVNEFIETITNYEAYVLFRGKVYFFNGPSILPGESFCRFEIYWFERLGDNRIHAHTIYKVAAQTPTACINAFLKVKIWEGKNFFEVEQEMRLISDETDVN